ncbi:MAG: squalene--hopene cyclase [Dehalococcoidales bacterium]|nr:squalene--hopene cyclase [Dehalococcoidales bacterium]
MITSDERVQTSVSGNKPDVDRLKECIRRTREYLLRIQDKKGFWVGELEADASVSAGYIPLMYFMTGRVDPEKQRKVVCYVKSRQNADGSWSTYPGGPGDLNVSVQVYFALKLAGIPASNPEMQKARDFILSRGGLMKTNTIVRIWLSLFGQFDYRGTPSIPPEIIYLPSWFYLNIYEFASWSRETIMALVLVLNTRPVCRVPEGAGVEELYLEEKAKRHFVPAVSDSLFGWKSFFLAADRVLKLIEKLPVRPLRRPALRRVEKWVVEHQERDGSWGGIMLPWIYSMMVLKSLGYGMESPVIRKGLEGLAPFLVEEEKYLRMQPATSPVWDTAWSLLALLESGLPEDHPSLLQAGRWLMEKEVRRRGDWAVKNPSAGSGCWSFEFDNDFYPDIDDSAVAPRALLSLKFNGSEDSACRAAAGRGYRWVCGMQSRDGGWAAFDRDNDKQVLANVPYADFMTPLDPTSADVTAHAVELASRIDSHSAALRRAIEYLKRTQQKDGAWYGRWGVNYLYGTGLVLVSLKAAGEDMSRDYITRAAGWIQSKQNTDGGWGETCRTYHDPALRGQGPSTASQTAWALMGLIASGQASSPAAEKGILYLLRRQEEDGIWQEEYYTGTGFPRAFYLRYDLYRIYFPLLALGQYLSILEEENGR